MLDLGIESGRDREPNLTHQHLSKSCLLVGFTICNAFATRYNANQNPSSRQLSYTTAPPWIRSKPRKPLPCSCRRRRRGRRLPRTCLRQSSSRRRWRRRTVTWTRRPSGRTVAIEATKSFGADMVDNNIGHVRKQLH